MRPFPEATGSLAIRDIGHNIGDRKVLAKNNGSSLEPQMAVSPNNIIYATSAR